MREDFLVWVPVEAGEFLLDELDGLVVVATTFVVREADVQARFSDLLLEDVALVEKEDEGGVVEPLAVANFVEQHDGLVHSVHRFVFIQLEVVLAEGHTENQAGDVLEAVNPLFALAALAADIHHTEASRSGRKGDL